MVPGAAAAGPAASAAQGRRPVSRPVRAEVTLLTDPVDAFWIRMAMGYDGKPFKSATQGTADLDSIPLKDTTAREEDSPAIGTLIAAIGPGQTTGAGKANAIVALVLAGAVGHAAAAASPQ